MVWNLVASSNTRSPINLSQRRDSLTNSTVSRLKYFVFTLYEIPITPNYGVSLISKASNQNDKSHCRTSGKSNEKFIEILKYCFCTRSTCMDARLFRFSYTIPKLLQFQNFTHILFACVEYSMCVLFQPPTVPVNAH